MLNIYHIHTATMQAVVIARDRAVLMQHFGFTPKGVEESVTYLGKSVDDKQANEMKVIMRVES